MRFLCIYGLTLVLLGQARNDGVGRGHRTPTLLLQRVAPSWVSRMEIWKMGQLLNWYQNYKYLGSCHQNSQPCKSLQETGKVLLNKVCCPAAKTGKDKATKYEPINEWLEPDLEKLSLCAYRTERAVVLVLDFSASCPDLFEAQFIMV